MITKFIKYFLMVIYKTKSDHQKKANISFLWDLGSLLGAMLFNSNSTIWYNIQIWWVLNTAGFSRRDVSWLIFFIGLVLVSPRFCLFINSITGEELVFPETFIRLHVFNTNV